MSLKGTRKILEDASGTPPAAAPRKKNAPSGLMRNVMLAVSLVLGIVVVAIMSVRTGKFEPTFLLGALVVCIPALFHKFVIPGRPALKHGFLLAGFYLGLWGLWPMLYMQTMVKATWASVVFLIYGVAVLACFALGAFLPKWM